MRPGGDPCQAWGSRGGPCQARGGPNQARGVVGGFPVRPGGGVPVRPGGSVLVPGVPGEAPPALTASRRRPRAGSATSQRRRRRGEGGGGGGCGWERAAVAYAVRHGRAAKATPTGRGPALADGAKGGDGGGSARATPPGWAEEGVAFCAEGWGLVGGARSGVGRGFCASCVPGACHRPPPSPPRGLTPPSPGPPTPRGLAVTSSGACHPPLAGPVSPRAWLSPPWGLSPPPRPCPPHPVPHPTPCGGSGGPYGEGATSRATSATSLY